MRLRQAEAAECGLVVVAIASSLLGQELDLATLRQHHPVSSRGLTLKEVVEIASSLDLVTRAMRCELDAVHHLATPAILHWRMNHFVVLRKVRGDRYDIIDPSKGPLTLTRAEFSKAFTGVALELSPSPAFTRRRAPPPISALSLIPLRRHLVLSLAHSFILSVILQIYVIVAPLYIKVAVDGAAVRGDIDLLNALAIGFAALAIFNTSAELMRNITLQRISSQLNWEMSLRLFHHMLRLPLLWFQRRKLADTLARFDSLTPIRNIIANGLVGVVIDGALALTTLGFMLYLSPSLTLLSCVGLAVYAALRSVAIPLSMRQSAETITASVAEQGKRIETLRAIQTIKAMAAEVERETDWSSRFARLIRATQTNTLWNQGFASVQRLVDALVLVATIYVGVKAMIAGQMSAGVLFAFIAYRTQLVSRAQNLFEQGVNWKLLDLHTNRIADIALQKAEVGADKPALDQTLVDGAVEAETITFAYVATDPPVFRNLSFKIAAGEFVAITGPSGVGKSTLLKCLCGLYELSAGQVKIDGVSLDNHGRRAVRRSVGIVLQDDELLSGSIADNVAFFDAAIDMDRVWTCLSAADIADEIRQMPMRAESLIGDMGISLSGGQKQRILLARALYRAPRILFLDEATSHLDPQKERSINSTLRAMKITRIVVAHRAETIEMADRVINLGALRTA